MDYNSSNALILSKNAIVNGTNMQTSVFESKGLVGGGRRIRKSTKSKSKSKYQKKGGKSKSRKNKRRSFRRK